ncbi:unnamed protein product [Acanthoscelides obtectus]|uniref:Uncharacterized protein n=1 Tax=Acanthoscelides obtectus TaxID=200917 RepID=A0A9P0Q8T1_ACAOB|nr:unnamed protein product [Acanthoscelides obtectus]CAK1629770.1 hypothetical protein AOBTE_LOCUS5941 [Acanthoscelides obtectus]
MRNEDAQYPNFTKRWRRFRRCDYSFIDRSSSGRPVESDTNDLKTLIEEDSRSSTRVFVAARGCSNLQV